jgi:hypothetical protein
MYYSSKYRDQPKKKAELFWGRTKKGRRGTKTTTKRRTIEGANSTINIVVRATIQRKREKKYQKGEV